MDLCRTAHIPFLVKFELKLGGWRRAHVIEPLVPNRHPHLAYRSLLGDSILHIFSSWPTSRRTQLSKWSRIIKTQYLHHSESPYSPSHGFQMRKLSTICLKSGELIVNSASNDDKNNMVKITVSGSKSPRLSVAEKNYSFVFTAFLIPSCSPLCLSCFFSLHPDLKPSLLTFISCVQPFNRNARFLNILDRCKRVKLVTNGPSITAKSEVYESLQQDPSEKIFDDRPEPDPNIPSIALLYEGFGHFSTLWTVVMMFPGCLILTL